MSQIMSIPQKGFYDGLRGGAVDAPVWNSLLQLKNEALLEMVLEFNLEWRVVSGQLNTIIIVPPKSAMKDLKAARDDLVKTVLKKDPKKCHTAEVAKAISTAMMTLDPAKIPWYRYAWYISPAHTAVGGVRTKLSIDIDADKSYPNEDFQMIRRGAATREIYFMFYKSPSVVIVSPSSDKADKEAVECEFIGRADRGVYAFQAKKALPPSKLDLIQMSTGLTFSSVKTGNFVGGGTDVKKLTKDEARDYYNSIAGTDLTTREQAAYKMIVMLLIGSIKHDECSECINKCPYSPDYIFTVTNMIESDDDLYIYVDVTDDDVFSIHKLLLDNYKQESVEDVTADVSDLRKSMVEAYSANLSNNTKDMLTNTKDYIIDISRIYAKRGGVKALKADVSSSIIRGGGPLDMVFAVCDAIDNNDSPLSYTGTPATVEGDKYVSTLQRTIQSSIMNTPNYSKMSTPEPVITHVANDSSWKQFVKAKVNISDYK